MADPFSEIRELLKKELSNEDLSTLRSAFEKFISGTDEEKSAASAIAANVRNAIAAYMDGRLSRGDLDFVLTNARDGAIALADAKVLRLKKAGIRAFFNVLTSWLLKKI